MDVTVLLAERSSVPDFVKYAESSGLHVYASNRETHEVSFRCEKPAVEAALARPGVILGLIVENVIAKMDLHEAVNLPMLKKHPSVQYDKQIFPGAIIRPYGSATFLLFGSGKMVCVGARSRAMMLTAAEKLIALIHDGDAAQAIKLNLDVNVENIVAQLLLKGQVDVEPATVRLSGVYYEPEIFPGMIYRINDPVKATFNIFSSGRVVCLGTKAEDDLKQAALALDRTLREHLLLFDKATSRFLLPDRY